jgi:hypothetical protein
MANQKKADGKGFCPFCGNEFVGDHDNCPFCGQDIRQYKDDLGPILNKIQTATNIDMKSPKVRVTSCIVIFLLVFAGALVIFDYTENHKPSEDPEPIGEALVIDVMNGGHIYLTGDFLDYKMTAKDVYDPDLMIRFNLANRYTGTYEKIMWIVQTDSYNTANGKNPFYLTVTKERYVSDPIETVTWENIDAGKFSIMANCYKEDGSYDVFSGYGVYYDKFEAHYTWTYQDKVNTMEYTMSSDDVKTCLEYDLTARMDQQAASSLKDFVVDNRYVADLNSQLKSQYNKTYIYTDSGYADFVLSFVQQCFPNVYDSFNYRVTDYWAYPAETILNGCGDDEDRAILFCSIMKVAGLGSALVTMPETVIGAVNINPDLIADCKVVRGVNDIYAVADSSSFRSLGSLRACYDIVDNGRVFLYNGDDVSGHCKVEEIPSN